MITFIDIHIRNRMALLRMLISVTLTFIDKVKQLSICSEKRKWMSPADLPPLCYCLRYSKRNEFLTIKEHIQSPA